MSEIELLDAILRDALRLQQLSASQEVEALRIMAEMEAELRQLLASQTLSDASKREIESLIREADEIVRANYAKVPGTLDTHELVLIVADRTVNTLRDAFPSATMPSAERLASLSKDVMIDGAPASEWWSRQAENTAFEFAREVRSGVIEGATQEQIVARIVGRGDEPGILNLARRNVRTLVHSSIMTAANHARLATFRKNARHAQGVRWVSTLDSHTCTTCAALDGQAWTFEGKPIGKTSLDFQMPPAHFSCRCVLTPVAKSLDDILGLDGIDAQIAATETRASSQGPTTARTFAEFLKRQTPEFIENTLGKRRAELWSKGKITLTDLVSGSGRPLTLDELKAL